MAVEWVTVPRRWLLKVENQGIVIPVYWVI